MVQAVNRYLALKRIVDMNPDIYGIVFCRTRQETKEVAEKLMRDGYNADALHGDLSQAQRYGNEQISYSQLANLVATDVAARFGCKRPYACQLQFARRCEVYTHRSGRTGRANKKAFPFRLYTRANVTAYVKLNV